MIVTKKALPRRTFLRGAGAALALPLLDAMVPALTAQASDPERQFQTDLCARGDNGCAGSYGFDGVERKKLSASSVPSKNGRPSDWAGVPSFWSGASPCVSESPWPCGSQVITT